MRIIDLHLKNFQGIKNLDIRLDGRSASIYGENATGKTTIYNALTWLLFGKPSTGAANWSPKPRGEAGELHHLDTTVTGVFSLRDGGRVTLKKVFHENWKRPRDRAERVFTGNSVEHYVDNGLLSEKEYAVIVESFCGKEDVARMLTIPEYFPEVMNWRRRRELLLAVCGDIHEADIIDRSPDLHDLTALLLKPGTENQYYPAEDYMKIVKARKAEIARQLDAMPARIDEARRAIPEGLPDPETLAAAANAAQKEAADFQKRIDGMAATVRRLTEELIAAQKELGKAADRYLRDARISLNSRGAELSELEKAHFDAGKRRTDYLKEAEETKRLARRLESSYNSIREDYKMIEEETFDPNSEACPTCGRRLPEDQIAAIRKNFFLKKEEKLSALRDRMDNEADLGIIARAWKEAESYEELARQAEAEAEALWAKRQSIMDKTDIQPFDSTEECKRLSEKVAEAERLKEEASREFSENAPALGAAVHEAEAREEALRRQYIQAENAQTQRARVVQLEAEEKRLAAEYEEADRGLYLCERFTRAKMSALNQRINSRFKGVRFQLFNQQINGSLSECCEVLVPGADGALVPYPTANHAARVNAGLEIIATLAKHFGLEMPVVVDNAESVTRLLDTGGQMIRLVVSAGDKALRVEVEA